MQLRCLAFIPFPTTVIGQHVGNPVAQQFYFGTLFVNGVVGVVLRWYATAGHRLVSPSLRSQDLRLHLRLSLAAPMVFLLMMILIATGVGRLINPLIMLGYLVALGYIVFAGHDPGTQRQERSETLGAAGLERRDPIEQQQENDERTSD
jgi:uncharacterized membrane protein